MCYQLHSCQEDTNTLRLIVDFILALVSQPRHWFAHLSTVDSMYGHAWVYWKLCCLILKTCSPGRRLKVLLAEIGQRITSSVAKLLCSATETQAKIMFSV